MTIGIHGYRDPKQVDGLPGMLLLPFIGKLSHYTINRRQWVAPANQAEAVDDAH